MPENHHRSGSRTIAALLAAIVLVSLAAPAQAGVHAARSWYGPGIESLAGYSPQKMCSPWAKPGVVDFARRLLRAYPATRSLGIVRACSAGGTSEHKEGRAFDWGGLNAARAIDRAKVAGFMTWLRATDRHGSRYAMARRLGIQYVIWNRKIWGSYAASAGWRRYTGSNPHRDHVHISFSWPGANKKTSFWTGKPFTRPTPPPPPPTPQPPTPNPGSPSPTTTPPRPEPQPADVLLPGPALTDETVRLDAGSAGGITTTGALSRDTTYLIEASGTYQWSRTTGAKADAECSRTPTDPGWHRNRSVHRLDPGGDHLDLYVDGVDLQSEPDTDTRDGCDTAHHVYRWTYSPARTGRVTFKLWDPRYYSDNSGSLAIRLIKIEARDELTWTVPARNATGRTSPGALQAGATYVATVTGTVSAGAGVTSDAECSSSTSDPLWRRDRSVAGSSGDSLDVLLDRQDVGAEPVRPAADGSRCDTDGHAYRFTVTPQVTRPVNLRVDDPRPGDNAGSLRVRVVRVADPTGPERLEVDSAAVSGTTTARVYLAGRPLRLSVTGTYAFAPGVRADAECSATAQDPVWRYSRSALYGDNRPLGDLTVGGGLPDWAPADGEGRCDAGTHTYALSYTPTRTGPLSLGVADTQFADNNGRLSVTIEPVN